MKKIISILLLFIVLVQTLSSFMFDAAYLLNRNYVTAEFCVNKNKPQMQCNGKCYLAKQKQKEQSNGDPFNDSKKEHFQAELFFLPETFILTANNISTKILYYEICNTALSDYQYPVFHPPAV